MSLLSLSNEILLHIFSYDCLRSSDLQRTILTCRRLYDIAFPFLYLEVCISARPNHVIYGRTVENVDRFFKHSALYPAQLSLIRTAELYWETDCPGRTNRLFDLLSRFSSIQRVSIAYAYPGFSSGKLIPHAWAFKKPLSLRHVKLVASSSTSISAQDIATLFFSIPNLETFALEDFNSNKLEGANASYPPTTLTKLEFLKSTSLPRGSLIISLLRGHPTLKTLIWTVRTTESLQLWGFEAVDEALSPLKPHLLDLRLMLKGRLTSIQDRERSNDHLNFSAFTMLQNIEIHERLAFISSEKPRTRRPAPFVWRFNRADLYLKLPASLETLTIYFDPGSYVLKNKFSEKRQDYSWILALAKRKATYLPRLVKVYLIERVDWEYQDHDVRSLPSDVAAKEWDYPLEVLKVFRKAGIALKVMLGPPERGSKDHVTTFSDIELGSDV